MPRSVGPEWAPVSEVARAVIKQPGDLIARGLGIIPERGHDPPHLSSNPVHLVNPVKAPIPSHTSHPSCQGLHPIPARLSHGCSPPMGPVSCRQLTAHSTGLALGRDPRRLARLR